MNETLYSNIADALVQDGYFILRDSLSERLNLSLLAIAREENGYKKAGISNASSFRVDSSKRGDKTKWLDEDDGAQSEYLEFANGLKNHLNRSLYLGLKYYESHFAIYDEGDFYEKHLDDFKSGKNRVVTTVYYLNENWVDGDGGELIIYDENDEPLERVKPLSNTMVVFLSDKFAHEVLKANKKRHSIAGWFRVDKI
jgi:SM-20-related protein